MKLIPAFFSRLSDLGEKKVKIKSLFWRTGFLTKSSTKLKILIQLINIYLEK